MKAVCTCDDVFDVLTREPFPSGGASDEFVESHLAVCHDCRQLAEAFRPAVGLFHESLAPGFDDELPMYRGRLKPIIDSLPPVSLAAPRQDDRSPGEHPHALTWPLLAIAAGLMVVGSVIIAALIANQRASGIHPVAASVRIHENRNVTLLAALEIPAKCRTETEALKLTVAADIACCTKCHNADSRIASTEKAIAKSSAACVACHDGRLDEALSAIEYDRLRRHFRKRFDAIKSQLAADGAVVHTLARSSARHAKSFDGNLVVMLDPRIHASRSPDADAPPTLWARRTNGQPRNPRSEPATTCEAERLG